jgi:hypothetical protein
MNYLKSMVVSLVITLDCDIDFDPSQKSSLPQRV